ncbi:MetQ/NlpA family ABC transporter substrate-binding protein [Shigella flexneri]
MKHVQFGVMNRTEQDVAEVAKRSQKRSLASMLNWSDFAVLYFNDATNHGELDANVFQHRPFLEQDNQAHGYKLVAVGIRLSSLWRVIPKKSKPWRK